MAGAHEKNLDLSLIFLDLDIFNGDKATARAWATGKRVKGMLRLFKQTELDPKRSEILREWLTDNFNTWDVSHADDMAELATSLHGTTIDSKQETDELALLKLRFVGIMRDLVKIDEVRPHKMLFCVRISLASIILTAYRYRAAEQFLRLIPNSSSLNATTLLSVCYLLSSKMRISSQIRIATSQRLWAATH